jgi:arylsulfatase A-like enzyme
MGLVRRLLRLHDGTRAGFYTVSAGIVLVFMGFPIAKFLIGRDVFMERLAWNSMKGLVIQACILASLCAMFFALAAGLRRLLDRLPDLFSGPVFTPVVAAVVSVGLFLVGLIGPRDEARVEEGPSPRGPNIVLVMVDTLRADVTDPLGGGLTPNLGRVAGMGVTFTHAYAHSSWTRPSVATVLSGRYPSSHGAMFKMEGLSDEVDTIAELLGRAGYSTHGIVSNYVTAPYFNFGQGFDEYVYLEPAYFLGAGEVSSKYILYEILRKLHSKLVPNAVRPNAQYRDGSHVTAEALRWVEDWAGSASEEDRFFLFVQYMDPHDPYFAHPDDGDAPSRKAVPYPSDSMRERFWSLYRGEVAHWDKQFGLLIEGLEKTETWEDTLVLVFADHGEEFLEHGGWWHGDTLYEEAIHVPLVVRLPGDEAAGEKVDDMVGLVDVAPTLVRLGGAEVPETYQGRDLFETRDSPIFAEEQHVGNDLQALVYRNAEGGIWKVIACNEENPRGLPPRSLFNLGSDPGEKENLAGKDQAQLKLALEALGEWMVKAAEGAVSKKTVIMDEASKERLKELGYIRDDAE